MKILVTGAGGFVGSHLAEAELAAGSIVHGLDRDGAKIAHLIDNPHFRFTQGNVLDRQLLESMIEDADLVYHLAAIANVQAYCDDPIRVMDINIDSTRLVAELAHKHRTKMVFSSSSEVYGKSMQVPFREDGDSQLGPTNKARWCYASSKIIGEHYLMAHAHRGLRVSIARFFNFYGPRLDLLGFGRVIPCFLECFLKNEPVKIVHPGDQTRSFTYVADGVRALMAMARSEQNEGEVFNIGDTREITMFYLASLMKEIGSFSSPIVVVPAKDIYGNGHEEIPRRVPDTTKIRNALGWQPSISLEDGLRQTIEWFRAQYTKGET